MAGSSLGVSSGSMAEDRTRAGTRCFGVNCWSNPKGSSSLSDMASSSQENWSSTASSS